MRKQIGGNRLGSGAKLSVEFHGYERSTHDLGYLWRTSMAPGTLIPFMVQLALPGDTWDIKLNADVKTHPTLGPLFGSFKLQLDVFEAPIRLYQANLMQNNTNLGNVMANVLLPSIGPQLIGPSPLASQNTDYDNCQINPSALLAYLGIRGYGWNTTVGNLAPRPFNGIPFYAYWEIYKQYYSNKSETSGAYLIPPTPTAQTISTITIDGTTLPKGTPGSGLIIGASSVIVVNYTTTAPDLTQILVNLIGEGITPLSTIAAFGTPTGTTITSTSIKWPGAIATQWAYAPPNTTISVQTFALSNIDQMKNNIMASQTVGTRFTTNETAIAPYGPCILGANTLSSQCGLALKTYQSDLLNNWMNLTWFNNITTATQISTAGNVFSIDALIMGRKVYDIQNRIAIGGGTYEDWLDAVYMHKPYSNCTTPMYHGGLSKEVIFQQVISNSTTAQQPLGTLAGRGTMGDKHKGGDIIIKVDEPSFIIGIVSLTPRIDYSQGNDWYLNVLSMDQLHKPGLDQIGFQDLITEQMAWWDTHISAGPTYTTHSAGKQPAWINYMTNINKTYGNFAQASNEMFMTLNRRYVQDQTTFQIKDLTTYIDPSHYNFIFAQTSLDAQNFWTQIAVDITKRTLMSAKIMPNL